MTYKPDKLGQIELVSGLLPEFIIRRSVHAGFFTTVHFVYDADGNCGHLLSQKCAQISRSYPTFVRYLQKTMTSTL